MHDSAKYIEFMNYSLLRGQDLHKSVEASVFWFVFRFRLGGVVGMLALWLGDG